MTHEVELDDLYNINLHLYNARVLNEDGTYTYELHGDFGIDAENLKRRFMYGFCLRRDIRENEPNADGIRDNIQDYDCMTVKVDTRELDNINTR